MYVILFMFSCSFITLVCYVTVLLLVYAVCVAKVFEPLVRQSFAQYEMLMAELGKIHATLDCKELRQILPSPGSRQMDQITHLLLRYVVESIVVIV